MAGLRAQVHARRQQAARLDRRRRAQDPGEIRTPLPASCRSKRVVFSWRSAAPARPGWLLLDRHGQVFVNEINTIPGALSFELWKYTGL